MTTTLLLLTGMGVGTLASNVVFLYVLASVRGKNQPEWSKAQHLELLAEFKERNQLLQDQNDILKRNQP